MSPRLRLLVGRCVVVVGCFVGSTAPAQSPSGERATQRATLVVHGRLMLYNGTPSYRIWIVGTKRVLGIHQTQDEVPDVPDRLGDLMDPDRVVFADFVVEPLTPYRPGVMQCVRVLSASKIVVTEQGKIVFLRSSL